MSPQHRLWVRWSAALCLALPALAFAETAVQSHDPIPPRTPSPNPAPQPLLTIDDLVERVLATNPDIRAVQWEREAALAGIVTAGALPNPRIDLQSGRLRSPLSQAPGSTTNLGLTQSLENPWLRDARLRSAQASAAVVGARVDQTRNDVVAQVRTLALEMLLRQEEAQALGESLQLLEQVRQRVAARVASGESPRYDLIKADAELVSARQRLQQAALAAERVATGLNRLAAGALPKAWQLQSSGLMEGLERLGPADGAETVRGNPEWAALSQAALQARHQLDLARASLLPAVEVSVQRGSEPDARQSTLGLSLTVPLWDRRRGPVAEAQAQRERAAAVADGRLAQLQQEWRIAHQTFEMARTRALGLSQGAIREAEAAVRVAEAAWRFGERGILDVLDAQRVLRSLRADLILARFEAQAARIELDRLEGRYVQPPSTSTAPQPSIRRATQP